MSSSNPSSIQFDPVTDLDPNTWYQISEQRVDVYTNRPFTSNLQVTDPDAGTVAVWPDNGDLWQFQPAATDDDDDDAQAQGRYSLRCSRTGIKKQLSVCYAADEISPGRTQPCLADSDGSERQKWEIASWGNETFRFVNLHNGSEYWLDVHQGNPPFLSDNIDTDIYQPAQRWLFSTISEVNDGGYSTVFTNTPSTDSPSTTTTIDSSRAEATSSGTTSTAEPNLTNGPEESSNSNSGIPVGTAAGVGVGVGLGTILIAGLIFFFWWRRRSRRGGSPHGASTGSPTSSYIPVAPAAAPVEHTMSSDKPTSSSGVWSGPEYSQEHGHHYVQPYHSASPQTDAYSQSPPHPHQSPVVEMSADNTVRQELDSGQQYQRHQQK